MRVRERLGEAKTPDGRVLALHHRAGHFTLDLDGRTLMPSDAHHSEEQMAEHACAEFAARSGARVLVGGLGMGFTLRAVLDRLGPDARVVVVELMAAVVEWNRGPEAPLAPLAGRPLDDPRVEIQLGDVADLRAGEAEPFDAILLDVDNGPEPFSDRRNAGLYAPAGLKRWRALLRAGGVLVIWSAFENPGFVDALRRAGFAPEVVTVRARPRKGRRYTLFVGRRRDA